ncbi:MAG: hypothetical protein KJZ68_09705, partial [Phycisphaerales bacterium]|nr:hypothetical protein [Phycisphaerales bacterium]
TGALLRFTLLVLVLVATMQWPCDASAQYFGPFDEVAFERVEETLREAGASAEQIAVARTFHDAMMAEMRAAEKVRDDVRLWLSGHYVEGMPWRDPAMLKRSITIYAGVERGAFESSALERDFFSHVRSLVGVASEQLDALERANFRRRMLRRTDWSVVLPDSVPLLDVVTWVKSNVPHAMSDEVASHLLEQYERTLHTLLVDFYEITVSWAADSMRQLVEALPLHAAGRLDEAAMRRILARRIRIGTLLDEARRLTRSTMDELAALLPQHAPMILAAVDEHEVDCLAPEYTRLIERLGTLRKEHAESDVMVESLNSIEQRLAAARAGRKPVLLQRLHVLQRPQVHEEWALTVFPRTIDPAPADRAEAHRFEPAGYAEYLDVVRGYREAIKALDEELTQRLQQHPGGLP